MRQMMNEWRGGRGLHIWHMYESRRDHEDAGTDADAGPRTTATTTLISIRPNPVSASSYPTSLAKLTIGLATHEMETRRSPSHTKRHVRTSSGGSFGPPRESLTKYRRISRDLTLLPDRDGSLSRIPTLRTSHKPLHLRQHFFIPKVIPQPVRSKNYNIAWYDSLRDQLRVGPWRRCTVWTELIRKVELSRPRHADQH